MDQLLGTIAPFAIAFAIALVPLTLLDRYRGRKARKIEAAQQEAPEAQEQERIEGSMEAAAVMRAQFGDLSDVELSQVYMGITQMIAAFGHIDENGLRHVIANVRLFMADEAQSAAAAAAESPNDSPAR